MMVFVYWSFIVVKIAVNAATSIITSNKSKITMITSKVMMIPISIFPFLFVDDNSSFWKLQGAKNGWTHFIKDFTLFIKQ